MTDENKDQDEGIKKAQEAGAHSATRTGGSDYNDGADATDYLGNDDQDPDVGKFDSGKPEDKKKSGKSGQVAHGNLN